ncbi:peptidase domain-containing ABC transporter [Tundrisphaera lichenicola]|uniref:peptidase domain-containing ABC transporter n=1 Tax=Tundrisphaera lichenicola TaxID=2029860 RepID=UPI003EC0DCF3
MRIDVPEALGGWAERMGIEIDPYEARRAFAMAEREVSGEASGVWVERLSRVGRDLGFRVLPARGTIAEALEALSRSRVVTAYRPEGWMTLDDRRGGRARLSGADPEVDGQWLSKGAIARRLGLSGSRESFDWAVLEPVATCEGLRDHGAGEGEGHSDHGGHHPSPLSRLLGLIRPESADLGTVVAFAVGVAVLTLATPLAVEALVSTVAMSLMVQQLVVLTLVLLACLGLAGGFRAIQTYVVEILQRRLFVRVAIDLADRLPRVRVDAFDGHHGPELVNRFFDILTVQKVCALLLLDGVALILQTAIGLLVLAFYHPYLLSFDLVMVAAMVVTVFFLGRGAIATSIAESRSKYAVADALEEVARVPRAYKIEGGADRAMERVDALSLRYLAARKAHFRILFRQVVFSLGFQALASASLLGLGGWLVIEGQLTLGQLVAAELIVATVAGSFTKLGKHLEGWYDLMAAVEKLGHLADLPTERVDGETFEGDSSGRPGASLMIRGVSYAYDGGREALRGVSLDLDEGERVALIGPSGSGKSTLAGLIYGLRAPTSGQIFLDGVNLRDLRLDALRRRVALVAGVEIIEGSVLENVRVGRSWISSAEVRRALRMAGLWDELTGLPDGLQTRLAPDGGPMSEGQARRLMVARGLAGSPRLLVIDGTLDGLDLRSRAHLAEALLGDPGTLDSPSLLLITHDSTLARLCHRSVVLDGGRAERGGNVPTVAPPEDWREETWPCRPD